MASRFIPAWFSAQPRPAREDVESIPLTTTSGANATVTLAHEISPLKVGAVGSGAAPTSSSLPPSSGSCSTSIPPTLLALLVAGWYAANAAAASGTAATLGGGRDSNGGVFTSDALALLSALQLAAAVALCALLEWWPCGRGSTKPSHRALPPPPLLSLASVAASLLPGTLFAAGTYFTNAALAAGGVGLTQAIKAAEPLAAAGLVRLLLLAPAPAGGGGEAVTTAPAGSITRRAAGGALTAALLAGGAAMSAAGAPKRGGGGGSGEGSSAAAAAARAAALAATADAALSGMSLQLRNVVLKHFQQPAGAGRMPGAKQPSLLPGSGGDAASPPLHPPTASSSAPAEFLPTCAVGAGLLGGLVLARRVVGAASTVLGSGGGPRSSLSPPPLPASPAALTLAVAGFAAYQALSFAVLRALDPVRHAALGNAKRAFVAVAGTALAGVLVNRGDGEGVPPPATRWPSAGVLAGVALTLAGAHVHAASSGGGAKLPGAGRPSPRPGARAAAGWAAAGLVGVVAVREGVGGWRGGWVG